MNYSNESIKRSVDELMAVYNKLNDNFIELHNAGKVEKEDYTPLYSNPQIFWNGESTPDLNQLPFNTITAVGKSKILQHPLWNNKHLLHIVCIDNSNATAIPNNYVVFKIKPYKNRCGTFFLNIAKLDNWGHGGANVYICSPDDYKIQKLLGCQHQDAASGEGFSPLSSPDNNSAQDTRYHQWLAFNYNYEDLILDKDGYAYIGACSTYDKFFIAGWAIAERNTSFHWLSGRTMQLGSLGGSKVNLTSTNLMGLAVHNFSRLESVDNIRIPYSVKGNLLLCAYCYDYMRYVPDLYIRGARSSTLYKSIDMYLGNFNRISPIKPGWGTRRCWYIPEHEVETNTYNLHGLKVLSLNVTGSRAEVGFTFNGFFTEVYNDSNNYFN